MVQYARGSAFAAKQQWPDAQKALDTLTAVWKSTAASDNKTVLGIAMHALIGEIAARRGKLDDAAMHYRVAMKLEDGLPYIEPPLWHYPIRHSLGKILLEAGKAAEAEKLYREDLKRFPGNGWSLHGLAASLRARGANVDAERVELDLRKAWAGADVILTASRF
jgi:tetratricopeptide (TPR) repeat protein